MAFFHQLRLLIWKNGLGVIRQPGWSLTLVLWPVIIFLILAITRHRFPPVMKDACYTGPKNLPSTGFFPFLQTLMCNTDSSCHNKSRLTTSGQTSRTGHSLKGPPIGQIVESASSFHTAWSQKTPWKKEAMLDLWENIMSSVQQHKPANQALSDAFDNTQTSQVALAAMLESMNAAKRLICTSALSAVNTSSPGALSFGVVTFCQSNDTLLEISLLTVNKMLMGIMLEGPADAVLAAGQVLTMFNQLQNDTSLLDSLLAIPRLLSSESLDQALVDMQMLLINLQRAMHMVQNSYPDVAASLSMVNPLLAGGINVIQYIEKWPGRDVYIALGDVVTLQNNTLSDAVQLVLQRVTIPLDKAIGLTMDRPMVHAYICENSPAGSLWLSAACMTGTVDMLLNWISPDKVAEQILLVWSRDVAAHDVTFAKGLLHSLLGMMPAGPGGQGGSNNSTRAQRSVDVQPQNIYEELFLTVGHVVLDIAKSVPEVDMVLQSLLRAGLDSMQTATLAVDTVEEMMDNILNDASQLQETFLMLMTNQTQASAWIGHVMDSVIEIIMQGLTSQGPVTCESLLGPFEWLLAHETVDASFWRTMLCQNSSSLQQALQTGWMPLIHKVQQTYAAIVDQGDYNYNVTLPMILSEWQKLSYNSVQFGALLDRLTMELGEGYWMSWISWNITYDVAGTLMDRAMWAVVRFGESLESSPLWPQVKTYMHIANWIVNYKPDVTTEPANCSLDMDTLSLDCDTGLNWPQFVQATSQALMTLPNEPQILISCLQGTLNLLQHVYGGVLQQQAASLFQQEIPGGDALSAYLSNVVSNLDDFFQSMTRLNSSHLSNTEVLLPLVHNLLQSTGLSPLMPLLYANGPLNVSTLLAVAVKLGRQNQYVFAFNETDPTMPDLERMLMQLLSAEGNLTLPLSLSMGHALLTYSKSLSPEGVARLREALQPFTNQTSTGIAEAILTAVEQLKRAADAPDGDPTPIILGCLRQLQEFLASALRVRRIDQFYLPSGQLSTGQVTDLHLVAMDILNLVTPEGLQNLTVAGPDAAQRVVLGKILAILPLEAQAHGFIADLQTLVGQLSFCTSTGQDCVASVSEIFTLLQQIVEIVVEGKGDVSISLAPSNPFLTNQESLQMTVTLFSLLLSPGDVAFVKTLNQTLYFIKLVMAKPNVTVSDVQNALTQSNLTLVELNGIAALAGAANINDLMVNILGIIKARQCFEPQDSPVVTTQCVMGLVNGLTGFLMNVPYLRNETAILSLIPLLVNNTISDVTYTITDFSSDPHMATIQILNSALANIKMNLQLLNLSSPEIVNEIKVVGGLLKLAANTGPFNTLNSTLLENPQYAQVAYLEIAQWYLEKVENVTSTSSFHSLLDPLYRFTEMQVALQLEQANFTLFVSNQVEELMKNLRYPIDGTGLSEIGQTAIKILQHQMELIKFNLEVQSDLFQSMGQEPVLNTTVLYSVENQITLQLNLISFWLKHPNVTSIFSSMLQWGSNSSSPGTDIHQLLQTMSHFLNSEQLTYLSLIDSATQALNNVVMVAQQPGGLQSAQFSGAILEAVQIAMHGLTAVTGPLPLSLRETILSVIQDSLNVATHGNFSSDPQMATMQILNSALTSVTMSLQLMNLSSSEIRNEIKMVEGLLNLATNTGPLNALDSPLMENPQYTQVVYLEIAQWYLKKVENATSTSSLNSFLSPFYRFTEMQLAVQLAQANFSLLVSNRVEHLTKNLRYPIDGTGLSEIGQTVIEILQHQMKLNKFNIEVQSDYFQSIGQEPMLNTTMLYSVCDQITQQLNLIRDWMKHPNVTSVFSSMLLWGSNSTNSSPGTDIHQLLQTLPPFFSSEIIDNVTQALVKALAVAQQPGGLQSAQFSDAVSEAAQIAMHSLTTVTGPLPVSVQETILKAVRDSLHLMSNADFGSDPLAATMQILNSVLDNIKMNLQLMNLSSPEIMNEIRMVEGLLKLVANTGPINALNSTLLANPQYALEAFLEIAQWYLKELENATSTSSLNSILYPFYRFTEMQVDVTLLYSNFTVFVSSELEQLIMNLYSYPINGTGVSEIGQTVIEILQQQVELIKVNLEFQNDFFQSVGLGPLLNTTILYPIENQITLQLNLIHDWVKHPDVTSIFSSMLQWGSSSTNTSSPGTDIHQLLQTMVPFFSGEQLTYVSLIDNATLALNNVIMVAQQPGGLQSAQFSGAILEVVQIALHSLTAVTGPLPLPLREAIQSVVQDLLSSISDGNINALANTTISVHLMNLTTFEIMNEIKVVEGLLNLATNTGPLDALNSTMLENPQYAQVAYLEVAQWYLEKVEDVTSASSFNSLLDPLYRFTEMQVAVQLAQANFTLFVSNQVEDLIMNLRYPIDGTGMSEIGQTVVEILQGQMELITFNLESQNDYFQSLGQEPLCNSTTMYAVEYEITQQINLIHVWMKHPNVTSVFSSMLQWGSSSTNTSSPGTDINQLLQTMSPFFSGEQLTYLSLIGNATQTLNNAVMLAQQPGGLQSAQFSGAILEVAQIAMHSLNAATGSLPLSLRENILSVLQGSLHLVLNPEMGYASSRNISLHILKNVEHIVQQTLPEVLADYLLPVIQIVTTYFQTIATASGQNQWNEIVLNEMMTIQGAVPSNMAQEYISLIINVTQFILEPSQGDMNIWTSFETGNLSVIISQMGELLNIVLTFVTGEQGLNAATGSLPLSLRENILSVLQGSLHLVLNPEMGYASSRNISLHILKKVEHIVQQTLPEVLADYLLPVIQIVTTYFQTIATASGQNQWNEIVLNEMMTIQGAVPSNMAQEYISLIINVTQFILEPSQGNMNLWTSFKTGNLSVIISQMGELLNTVLTFVTGEQGLTITIPSLGDFAELGPVLEQILTEEADQDTWEKLEKMLEAVLSNLKGTQLWDDIPSAISLVETVIGVEINQMMAETAFIWSLQRPVLNLMEEVVLTVNTSRFNLSEVTQRLEKAISGTMHAAQQANGTLQCSEVLRVWEPVGEAAGLSAAALAMWCDVSLQPVLEAYAASDAAYGNLNTTHDAGTPGTVTVDAAASSIVQALSALYRADQNEGLAVEGLIMAFCDKLEQLVGRPLSAEAQLNLLKQFQETQTKQSEALMNLLTADLLRVAPSLREYVEACDKALTHIIQNLQHIQNDSSAQNVLMEAGHILLTSLNVSADSILPLLWGGDVSGANVTNLYDLVKQVVHLVVRTQLFGDVPMIYQVMEQVVASNDTAVIVETMLSVVEWWSSTQATGMDLVTQALSRVCELLRAFLPILTELNLELPANAEMFEELIANVIDMVSQIGSTGGLLAPIEQFLQELKGDSGRQQQQQQQQQASAHAGSRRRRREAPSKPTREPMDDFIDLFFVDYASLFEALSVAPAVPEIVETAHVFFSNADLGVVMKGATKGLPWALNSSKDDTIDAALGVLSYLTLPDNVQTLSMDLLMEAVNLIPDGLPLAGLIKNVTGGFASESQENLMFMQQTLLTALELFSTSPTDQRFTEILGHLTKQVCALEQMDSVAGLWQAVDMEPGLMCNTVMPSLMFVAQGLLMNTSEVSESVFQIFIGNPLSYDVKTDWATVFSESFGLNASSLQALNINVTTSSGVVTVGEILRNKTAFMLDVQRNMEFDPHALSMLLESPLPSSNLVILSWLVNLRHCDDSSSLNMSQAEQMVFQDFCSLSIHQWYTFSLLLARHLNTEKLIYRMVLSQDMQSLVGVMLQMASFLTDLLSKLEPAIGRLESYLSSLGDLNLVANKEFSRVARSADPSKPMSRTATFTTLSRALCSKGILAVFGISKLTIMSETDPSLPQQQQREELIKQFKIPHDASPFCMSLYLDMVNTTGGAIAWAFLKPMLMGHILFTPNTPLTRAIMEKSNSTLQEFANLRSYSEDWIESSSYISKSAKLLTDMLPMLQNSLGNSFVENFIQMQTNINVGSMKDTLSNFSNMTVMLEKNQEILKQITTLSNLMVNISSCIKFDRYRGFDTAEELNSVAQDLAKNRDLYGSVIFKLPKDEGSSKNDAGSSSNSSSTSSTFSSTLPPRVRYTIRMHMDNLMRTDRVRTPYFVRDHHISAAMTLRYNRGFIYLQESIDRAIIETQAGQKVTEPAVQLQPFPYPCFIRDEYLEAISFVFPLMLMIAWVLFVADFVKKLVHERELRLHEYMKMMGVNPLSHFFAWFLECAAYLVFTIFILTLVLKYGRILPNSDGFLLFLYFCDYGLSIVAISFLVSSFFDKTYIAGLSGSLVYVLCFFPFIVMMALESKLSFAAKSALGLFSPTCFSYASQYISRYESQGEGIQWSNSYISPMAGDTASFGWLCWLMLIDSLLYFIMGGYIRMVFPGKYGLPAPWYFPFTSSFWADLCCSRGPSSAARGMLFTNIMQKNQAAFDDDKGKGKNTFSSHQEEEETSGLPVGVALHGLTKFYGDRPAIQNLNVSFYEGQVTSLLGHNGAGKTTTMSLLTGLFAPSSGSIEVYGRDMQANIEDVRKELGVCMQYDVHFDHMTAKEHLMLYGQIKAPYWSRRELDEQVCKILQETGMYAHRHKRVGTLSGGMKRKLSISIAFIGGSRLVVLDEPTTGVDPCSRRSIWDIVIQHKKERTIIMSTHHLDEAEVLSDRIAFLERGGLKVCGTPLHLKDKLGQGYNLTLTKKLQSPDSEAKFDSSELKEFIQAHVPEARLKEAQVGDLVYSLPPFTSSNASSYRSLLTALDANLDALQLGCYGISDTTLEEVFLQLTQEHPETEEDEDRLQSISESIPDYGSTESLPEDLVGDRFNDKTSLTGSSTVKGLALVWQQVSAMLVKRFHHSRRDWKGLISQIVLPVIFVVFAMGLGSIKSDLQHYPELELSPALYNIGPSYSFFSNQNPSSSRLVDSMMSYPGIDNACLDKPDSPLCNERKNAHAWKTSGNSSQPFSICRCNQKEQVCNINNYQPPNKKMVSSQSVYNLTGIDVENYLVSTANDFIRNRYGGFIFGKPLPPGLQMDLMDVPKNRTVSKVWYNPEGHHTMPAYLNSLNNFILRSNIPADKDPRKYAISVSSHPYYGRQDDEDAVVQGMIQILVALCVLTGYSIMTASFAIYEVQEHHSGSKRLQHISGVSEPLYWAVNFFYDMVLYMIPVALTVAVVAIFQVPAFTERHNLGAVTLLLVLFGFSTFPWMYLLSGVFKDAEMAFITYVCINLFISVNTIMTTSIVYFMGQLSFHNEPIKVIFEALSNAFLIFPQFSFGNGLMELARINMEVQLLSGYGIDAYRDPFSTETLGWMFLSSLIQGLVFFALRLLINKGLIRTVRHLILGRKVVPQATNVDDDEDVVAESERVASGAAHTDLLQVNQLTKIYQHLSKKVHAVKRLSVGIPAGECFGLLGVNGAGKTTTFKMLTGDVSPTDGTAQIKDWDGRMVDIMECRNQGINIGYCPQVDALDDLLTGEEHLYFYARVRGISKGEIDSVVNYLLKKLELDYHRTTITDAYSCGTRRKLSTALALIGHPQILLLDEPSSGMDPRTKRHLWKIISEEVKGKCAVVLTSHSMEECEALCSRLAIMVKGQFRCLGSLQHIKNRFGSGFTVKMYLARASCDVEAITGFMRQRFPSTYLKDQHSAMVEYHVPVAPGGVADIFDQLESNKTTLQIKHFSISQTTLDEVFINFAMGKVGMETVPLNSEDSESLFSIESSDT